MVHQRFEAIGFHPDVWIQKEKIFSSRLTGSKVATATKTKIAARRQKSSVGPRLHFLLTNFRRAILRGIVHEENLAPVKNGLFFDGLEKALKPLLAVVTHYHQGDDWLHDSKSYFKVSFK